ncbi:hypothetical protein R1sor_002220 [Riccia sorocarpa]|uniref:Uncharacterized protein n=1 Tax=Riccia sorocarpa TaxID=122646 RepID=A0ABD3GY63_9MARC
MGRKSYNEVIPLVCCSDETYVAFEKFVKRWKEGTIPNVHGTIGPSKDPRTGLVADRDFSQLSVNRFRPINGLSDEDLKLAWTVLEEGKVWVKILFGTRPDEALHRDALKEHVFLLKCKKEAPPPSLSKSRGIIVCFGTVGAD